MEFLDFLKYGAIGISLALAILSYRLLSKEQDKPEVRKPILNTIKIYFLLAVFLSVFFGAVEILTSVMNQKESKSNIPIDKIWESYFNKYPDSTTVQKTNRISAYLSEEKDRFSDITAKYENCRKELEKFDKGFYQNVIKLKNALKSDADEWINIDYETEKKTEVIDLIKGIFMSFGENYDSLSGKEVVAIWVEFKSKYTANTKKFTLIENSDITHIVRKYLDLQEEE